MLLTERIEANSDILAGKPAVRGTRLAVEFILELLAAGESESDIIENYPGLRDLFSLAAQAAEKTKLRQLKITFTRPREQWITDIFKGGEGLVVNGGFAELPARSGLGCELDTPTNRWARPIIYSVMVQLRTIKLVLSHATLYSIEDAEN